MTTDTIPGTVPDLSHLSGMVADHPLLLILAAAAALVVAGKVALSGRQVPKDPTRMFTAAQRAEGFSRAGSRCELNGVWLSRCRRPASHGDHWYPWSKGGATSMGNFVAACPRCNTSKGAKIPTALATFRLISRRRRYFPAGLDSSTGQKFVQR